MTLLARKTPTVTHVLTLYVSAAVDSRHDEGSNSQRRQLRRQSLHSILIPVINLPPLAAVGRVQLGVYRGFLQPQVQLNSQINSFQRCLSMSLCAFIQNSNFVIKILCATQATIPQYTSCHPSGTQPLYVNGICSLLKACFLLVPVLKLVQSQVKLRSSLELRQRTCPDALMYVIFCVIV